MIEKNPLEFISTLAGEFEIEFRQLIDDVAQVQEDVEWLEDEEEIKLITQVGLKEVIEDLKIFADDAQHLKDTILALATKLEDMPSTEALTHIYSEAGSAFIDRTPPHVRAEIDAELVAEGKEPLDWDRLKTPRFDDLDF